MANNETKVLYKAIANFSDLHRKATRAKQSIRELKNEEAALNKSAQQGAVKTAAARDKATKSVEKQKAAVDSEGSSLLNNTIKKVHATQATKRLEDATKKNSSATKKSTEATDRNSESLKKQGRHVKENTGLLHRLGNAIGRVKTRTDAMAASISNSRKEMAQSDNLANRLHASFIKLGNWRPRLTPPFIALVPIIGGLLSMINPLIAGVGALGGAILGLGSSLASLSGSALALPGLLGAIAIGISSVVGAFGGVGGAFESFGKFAEAKAAGEDTTAQVAEYKKAIAELSPAARHFVQYIVGMREQWSAMRKEVQETFFSEIEGSLEGISKMVPVIGRLWNKAAASMGKFFANGIDMISSPEWIKDFDIIGDDSVGVLDNLGSAALSLLDALRHITVAAGPFTKMITDGWAKGAKNMAKIAGEGRSTGKLAAWLDKVNNRLQQWWRIVKNIGSTLFNYGAASGEFGQWITNRLEAITQGWEDASKRAAEADSPFQNWLQDIKPILGEMKRSVALFFGWFADTSADPKNLKQIETIFRKINDELGPAVSKFLDAMAEAEIGPAFVDGVTAIVEALTGIMKNGGGELLKSFWQTIVGFFQTLRDLLKDPVWGPVLVGIGKALGVIAALTFIGKFSGLTSLIGALTGISGKKSSLLSIFKGLKDLKDKKFGGWIAMFKSLGALAKVAGVIGLITALSEFGSQQRDTAIDEAIKDLPKKDQPRAEQTTDTAGETNSTGTSQSNFGTGPASILDEDIDLVGEVQGWFDTIGPTWEARWKALGDWWEDTKNWLTTSPSWDWDEVNESAKTWWEGLWEGLGTWFEDFENWMTTPLWDGEKLSEDVTTWWEGLWDGIGKWWEDVTNWLGTPLWSWDEVNREISNWWNGIWEDLGQTDVWKNIQGAGQWLSDRWNEFLAWCRELPGRMGAAAGDIWTNLTGPDSWLGTQFAAFQRWVARLPDNVRRWAGDIWNRLTGPTSWLGKQNASFARWVNRLPENVRAWAGDIWKRLTGPESWLGRIGESIRRWAVALPGKVGSWIGNIFKNVGTTIAGVLNLSGGGAVTPSRKPNLTAGTKSKSGRPTNRGMATGGSVGKPQYLANGGRASGLRTTDMRPMGTDTVPTMLTPGEVVIRKGIVDKVGEQNLLNLNKGVLSYQELLRAAMSDATGPTKPKSSSRGAAYLNGGGLVPSLSSTRGSSLGNSAAVGAREAGQTIIDNRTMIENLTIQNPKPEPASESLPRSLRKVGYLTSARSSS